MSQIKTLIKTQADLLLMLLWNISLQGFYLPASVVFPKKCHVSLLIYEPFSLLPSITFNKSSEEQAFLWKHIWLEFIQGIIPLPALSSISAFGAALVLLWDIRAAQRLVGESFPQPWLIHHPPPPWPCALPSFLMNCPQDWPLHSVPIDVLSNILDENIILR